MSLNRILILNDFSDASQKSVQYGLQLAQSLEASTWIQHVYYIPPDLAGQVEISQEALKNYEKNIYQQFDSLKSELGIGEDTQFVVNRGDLIEEMNRLIDKETIDLVVVGNHGGGGWTNILGSNTVKIIQHAHCPVLSVPEAAIFKPFRQIAFAADLKETSPEVLIQLVNFAQTFQAHVDVIHVSDKTSRDSKEEFGMLEQMLHPVSHTFYYAWDKDIEEGILEHVQERQNDILVLVPRVHPFFDRLFQKSISQQMVYHSKLPLLSIHEYE